MPRDPNQNGVAAMLVVLTKGANANPFNPFVFDYQHGGDDITCSQELLN